MKLLRNAQSISVSLKSYLAALVLFTAWSPYYCWIKSSTDQYDSWAISIWLGITRSAASNSATFTRSVDDSDNSSDDGASSSATYATAAHAKYSTCTISNGSGSESNTVSRNSTIFNGTIATNAAQCILYVEFGIESTSTRHSTTEITPTPKDRIKKLDKA